MATKKATNKKTSKQKRSRNKKPKDVLAITLLILDAIIVIVSALLLKLCHNPKKGSVLDIHEDEYTHLMTCYGFRKDATKEEILEEFPTELVIPEGVQIVAADAFVNVAASESKIPEEILTLSFENNSQCQEISQNAFKLAPFSTINLPNNIQIIGEDAFASTSITKIDFPNQLTSIGNKAFEGNNSLSEIRVDQFNSLPLNLFGSDVFLGKPTKGTIYAKTFELALEWKVAFLNQGFIFDENNWKIVPDKKDTVLDIRGNTLYGFVEEATEEDIREEFGDNMIIPEEVTKVNDDAFRDIDSLEPKGTIPDFIKKITFVKPENITEIGNRAFAFNSKIEQINLNNLTALSSLGDNAFVGCSNLNIFDSNGDNNILSLNDNMFKIGESAFKGCVNIEGLVLPLVSQETTIGQAAFAFGGNKLHVLDFSKLEIEIVEDETIHYSSTCSMQQWMNKANFDVFSGLGGESLEKNKLILPLYNGDNYTRTTAFLLADTKEEAISTKNLSGFYWVASHLIPEDIFYLLNWQLVET